MSPYLAKTTIFLHFSLNFLIYAASNKQYRRAYMFYLREDSVYDRI